MVEFLKSGYYFKCIVKLVLILYKVMMKSVLNIVELIIVLRLMFFFVKNVDIIEIKSVGVEFFIVMKVVLVIFGLRFKYLVIWFSDVMK